MWAGRNGPFWVGWTRSGGNIPNLYLILAAGVCCPAGRCLLVHNFCLERSCRAAILLLCHWKRKRKRMRLRSAKTWALSCQHIHLPPISCSPTHVRHPKSPINGLGFEGEKVLYCPQAAPRLRARCCAFICAFYFCTTGAKLPKTSWHNHRDELT